MNAATKTDLTTGSVRGHLIRLSLPMVWGLLATISFQLADMYFLARLGPLPLVAIGFTFPVTMAVLSLIIAMGISTSSIVSRRIGAGDRDEVMRLSTHVLMIAAIGGAAIAVIGLLTVGPVFRAMGATDATLPLIRSFMEILYLGTVFQAVMMVGNSVLRAGGDTRSPALILVACAMLNIVLDPLLIYGLYGLPRLEMRGAAIANVVSFGVAMAAGLAMLAAKGGFIARAHVNFRSFGDTLKRFLVIALPVGVANVIQPVINGVVIALLAGTGHDAVAAFGIVARIEAFAFVVIMALAIGMGPIVGQNWGAKSFARVNAALRDAFGFVFLWSVAVAVVLILLTRPIAHLFTDDEGVIRVVGLYFLIVMPSYAFGNLVNGWASAFNAMGLPKNAFLLIVIRLVGLTLPLVWLGARWHGVTGIFLGITAANVIAGGVGYGVSRSINLRQQAVISYVP